MSTSARSDAHGMDAKALARAKRDALLRRTRRIRRAVAVLAVAMFVATFAIVYVQLASGHDPALTAAARRRAALTDRSSGTSMRTSGSTSAEATEASAGTEASGSEGTGEAEGSETGGEEASGSEESGPSAVTTSQS